MIQTITLRLFGLSNSQKIHPEKKPATSHHKSKKDPRNENPLSLPLKTDLYVSNMRSTTSAFESVQSKNPNHLDVLNEKREKTTQGIKHTEDRDPCHTIYLECKTPTVYDSYKSY